MQQQYRNRVSRRLARLTRKTVEKKIKTETTAEAMRRFRAVARSQVISLVEIRPLSHDGDLISPLVEITGLGGRRGDASDPLKSSSWLGRARLLCYE